MGILGSSGHGIIAVLRRANIQLYLGVVRPPRFEVVNRPDLPLFIMSLFVCADT